MIHQEASIRLARLVLAIAWIWIGVLKLVQPDAEWLYLVGAFEVALGVGVLSSWWRILGEGSLWLCFLFFGITLLLPLSALGIAECGCFGHWEPSQRSHLLIILGIASVSLVVASGRPVQVREKQEKMEDVDR